MKKNVNLKPSQEYTNVSITYKIILLKIKHSKNYIYNFYIYPLSYKHISRGHISA